MRRGIGAPKPLWQRIFGSALLMALFGWLLGLILGPHEALLTAIISGGLLGLRPLKLRLGLLIGVLVGRCCGRSTAGLTRRWSRRW